MAFAVADRWQGLAHQPLPGRNRAAVVTNAGGVGVLAADACQRFGLALSPLSGRARQVVAKVADPHLRRLR